MASMLLGRELGAIVYLCVAAKFSYLGRRANHRRTPCARIDCMCSLLACNGFSGIVWEGV
jgi:hypothetical protein